MASKNKWISGAIKRPGAFKAKAKRARKTVSEYAREVLVKGSHASELTKQQARLIPTLAKMRKRKK